MTPVKWIVTLLAIAAVAASTAGADTHRFDRPELTVRISPSKPYLQQQIIQTVRLVSAHPFDELNMSLGSVGGADIIVTRKPAVRKFLSYGVEGFAYETSRVFFAKTSGTLRIPAVDVTGRIVVNEQDIAFHRKSDPVALTIAAVPDSYQGDQWLVATRVEMNQTYSKPLDQLRVGDTVRRTLSLSALGVSGEHLPALTMRPSRGLTILAGSPIRKTEIDGESVRGLLEQSFDLRIDIDQPMDFGPINVPWWNWASNTPVRSRVQAVRLEPLPRDVDASKRQLMAEVEARRHASRAAVAGITALAAIIAAALLWISIGRNRKRWYDRRLLRIARQKPSPAAGADAILAWARAALPNLQPLSLGAVARRLGQDLSDDMTSLNAAVYSGPPQKIELYPLAVKLVGAAHRRQRSRRSGCATLGNWLLGAPRGLPTLADGFDDDSITTAGMRSPLTHAPAAIAHD